MKKLSILLFPLFLFSCKPHHNKPDPEAMKLNDSAVNIMTSMLGGQLESRVGKDSLYKIQLKMLNRATKIDSNYFVAYVNKFGAQCRLKRYKDALITGKEMVRLAPKDPVIKFLVGKIYEQNGDTILARSYYQDYLSYCDDRLDTMSTNNKSHKDIELQKAMVLVLLNQEQKGHEILNRLSQQADDWDKDTYIILMHLKRADMIECKDTSITIGNRTTSINTFFP
ncbi:MAG: hypothetical protein ABI203_07990 [Mucilaginibacter sp.]